MRKLKKGLVVMVTTHRMRNRRVFEWLYLNFQLQPSVSLLFERVRGEKSVYFCSIPPATLVPNSIVCLKLIFILS